LGEGLGEILVLTLTLILTLTPNPNPNPTQFDCNSKDLVNIISCAKCNKLDVGETSRMLKERLYNHRSDIKLNKNTAVSKHFNDIGHAFKDLRITPIFSLGGFALHERLTVEAQYMKMLNTYYPRGLNYPLTLE